MFYVGDLRVEASQSSLSKDSRAVGHLLVPWACGPERRR